MDYLQRARNESEQAMLDAKRQEDSYRQAYDTLWGYFQGCTDVYARAALIRHLERLYEAALNTVPDHPGQSAETADVKTTSPSKPASASTATSYSASGSSAGKDSSENSR